VTKQRGGLDGEAYKKDLGKTEHEPEHTELAQSEGACRHESEVAGKGLT
jgi:hypothetical protein